jgi:hypothetical protein
MAHVNDIALTAGFLVTGMRDFCDFGGGGMLYDRQDGAICLLSVWGQGCLELHATVTQYAPLVAQLADDLFTELAQDFPGVWDYEVTEALGRAMAAWIAEHPEQTPPPAWVKATLLVLAGDFLSRSGRPYGPALLRITQSVSAVLPARVSILPS